MNKPELLSPAGNYEKMTAALEYGADAVYLAGRAFGMRSAADNFSVEELYAAVDDAHARGKKVYLTVNTMPHEDEYPALREYLTSLRGCAIDAMIVADLGTIATVREILPETEIHISTQASIVSSAAARAYAALGAKRVVLARELTLNEIRAIREHLDSAIELEVFIHGSMCVSYSGRCLLANALNGRDGNRGTCTQPCRWNYTLIEEKRPDSRIPIEETNLGTFIMSSKDLCMIEHIPELCESGIASLKIEGRMKSAYYTAVVSNAYRMAIDAYLRGGAVYRFDPQLFRELESVSHRDYGTGYWFDTPREKANVCKNMGYIREKAYIATALGYDAASGRATFVQRNKVSAGETVELISPGKVGRAFPACELCDEAGAPIESAPHPGMIFSLRVPFAVKAGDILRGGN